MPTNAQWAEARQEVLATFDPSKDQIKWSKYTALREYADRLAWRLREGHEEFVRLQRLEFYGLISS